jgi:hypothetical protein
MTVTVPVNGVKGHPARRVVQPAGSCKQVEITSVATQIFASSNSVSATQAKAIMMITHQTPSLTLNQRRITPTGPAPGRAYHSDLRSRLCVPRRARLVTQAHDWPAAGGRAPTRPGGRLRPRRQHSESLQSWWAEPSTDIIIIELPTLASVSIKTRMSDPVGLAGTSMAALVGQRPGSLRLTTGRRLGRAANQNCT